MSLTKALIESVYPEVENILSILFLKFYYNYMIFLLFNNNNNNKIQFVQVFESYTIQLAIPEAKYEEKLKFWEQHGINCFERWTVPYFMEREKERKRPCLRLNYPPDGKCNDCVKGSLQYFDMICMYYII